MSDNSNINEGYMNNSSWTSLFEMAENFEEQENSPVYNNVSFLESFSTQDARYHSPEEALKVLLL